jgi:hypothetical protein
MSVIKNGHDDVDINQLAEEMKSPRGGVLVKDRYVYMLRYEKRRVLLRN